MTNLQKAIHEWQMETFKSSDEESKFNHLAEEMVELKEAIISGTNEELEMEIADCFLLLTGIASLRDIDIIAAARKKLEINKQRDWGEPDELGIVRHIDD